MKRILSLFVLTLMVFNFSCCTLAEENTSHASNVRYPAGVSHEMTDYSFWTGLRENPDEVLLSLEDINRINGEILADGAVNHVVDIENVSDVEYSGIEVFDRDLFVNGTAIDENEVIAELEASVEDLPEQLYAVTVKRAHLRTWPMRDFLGYTENDPDDELQNSVLEVNSPVVIFKKSNFRDHTYYYCQSEVLFGWFDSDELAVCRDKNEWLESWKVDIFADDFLVVCEDKIVLEPMLYEPAISEVELRLGTKLKLVPEAELPDTVGEREGTLFNYVVYIPTRDEGGNYVRKVALIPERCHVSVGYVPFTETNLTSIAFKLLGSRYGWGGTLKSYDSSLYNRQVYSCFGFRIPTNTTWQKSIQGYATDVSELTEEEKLEFVKGLPIGSLLYIPGCSMQYIGCIGDMPYVIADAGVFSVSAGEPEVRRYYTASILPMSAQKKDGTPFMTCLQCALNFCK